MTTFVQLYWLRRFGASHRFHNIHMTRPDTIFHHSASAALILIQLFGDRCSVNLLKAILQHDLEEGITGDIPAPVKWHLDTAKLSELEARVRDYFHIRFPELTEEETRMLKAADFLDATFTCLEQRIHGNNHIDWVFHNYLEYSERSDVVSYFPETQDLWRKIKESYPDSDHSHHVYDAELHNFWYPQKS